MSYNTITSRRATVLAAVNKLHELRRTTVGDMELAGWEQRDAFLKAVSWTDLYVNDIVTHEEWVEDGWPKVAMGKELERAWEDLVAVVRSDDPMTDLTILRLHADAAVLRSKTRQELHRQAAANAAAAEEQAFLAVGIFSATALAVAGGCKLAQWAIKQAPKLKSLFRRK